MAISADRPQDVGRPHRKSKEQRRLGDLTARYQRVMRRDLFDVLQSLETSTHIPVAEREKRWRLAIVLARELGSDIDPPSKGKPTSIATVPHDTAEPEF